MKVFISHDRMLIVRRGHWLERALLTLPFWLLRYAESARVGDDTKWTRFVLFWNKRA